MKYFLILNETTHYVSLCIEIDGMKKVLNAYLHNQAREAAVTYSIILNTLVSTKVNYQAETRE